MRCPGPWSMLNIPEREVPAYSDHPIPLVGTTPPALEADPRDLGSGDLSQLRATFEDTSGLGLWLFAVHICGLTKLTTHLHWEMCRFLSMWGQPGWRRLMMMVPRGTYKTSIGSKALPLWIATKDPTETIGLFNAAQDQAKSWIGNIRAIIEVSKLYHLLWPERLPPGIHFKDRDRGVTRSRDWPWGASGLDLVGHEPAVSERTFEPYGIGGSSTGRHYSRRIMDDLIGETAVDSPAMIEDAINFVDNARALERPAHAGCELINCTPWAYRDCYSHVLTKWPKDYKVYRRSLLENPLTGEPDVINGESIFPEVTTTEAAKEMYEVNPYVFSSQQQCIPQAGREVSFNREWVHPVVIEVNQDGSRSLRIPPNHYDPHRVHGAVHGERAPDLVPLHWCNKAILIDPAPSKKGEKSSEPRARNGLVACAYDPWGRRFTLQSVPLREDPVTVMEAVVLMAVFWKITKVGIEEVNFSAVYQPLWTALLKHRYPSLELSFVPLLTKGEDKETRINSMKGPHREGLWYYNLDRCGYILQELLEYPNSETRDLIDAQAYWPQALNRPPTPTEMEQTYYANRNSGRSAVTGY